MFSNIGIAVENCVGGIDSVDSLDRDFIGGADEDGIGGVDEAGIWYW